MVTIDFTNHYSEALEMLTQWNANQTLMIRGLSTQTTPVIAFSNRASQTAVAVQARTVTGGYVCDIPNGLLTKPYTIYVDVRVSDGTGIKSIERGRIRVRPTSKPDDYEYVENITLVDITSFIADIDTVKSEFNSIKSMVGGPSTAGTKAAMTDTSKVYVYTGSETGMVNGNWYYHDGTNWVSGGVYNAIAVDTDKTLSVDDMAADAAAAGSIIEVGSTQPSSEANKLWIDPSADEIEIPEMSDLKIVEDKVDDLKSEINLLNKSIDYIAGDELVTNCSIPLGTTTSKTLLSSIYLLAGKYILTYTQKQTQTANARNTPWWSPAGGTKTYQSSNTNYNLSAGTYNWAINIPSDGNYDFGLWVNTPSIATDYVNFYLHKVETKTQISILENDIDELNAYIKGIYQKITITGNAFTNVVRPFFVKTGDVINVTNNGTEICSAYTCSADGTAIDTISSSIGANGSGVSITAANNADYIKIWSSAAVNVEAYNSNNVIQRLMDQDGTISETLKLITNDVVITAIKSGNYYAPYAFKAGYTYVVTNNSSDTCSLATCDAGNTAVDLISGGLPSGKSIEFTATANAVSLRVWSSGTSKNVQIESHNTLEYYNQHNISGPYVPAYYNAYLPDKLATIRELGSSVCVNGEQFIFLTDYHDYKNAKQSPALVKYLFEKTGVKFIVFGGDNINLGNGYSDVFDEIANFFGDFNFLDRNQMIVITGNHEHFSNVTSGYADADVPTNVDLYYAQMNQRSLWEVAVDEYGDFILANPLSKIYYCVFSSDYEALISDGQINAVADMVMELTNGWHIMFMAHRLLMGDASVIANTNLANMADAIAAKTSVTIDSVTHNFSTKNLDVLPLLSGHTHQDGMVRTTGGLPVIGTTTDAIELDLINTRTKGTVDEQAFDVVSLDMTNRVIYLTRIGAGSDRQYSY